MRSPQLVVQQGLAVFLIKIMRGRLSKDPLPVLVSLMWWGGRGGLSARDERVADRHLPHLPARGLVAAEPDLDPPEREAGGGERLICVSQDLRNSLTVVVRRAISVARGVWLKKGGSHRRPTRMAATASRRSALAAATLEERERTEHERKSAPEGGGIDLGDGSRGNGRVNDHHVGRTRC